jgi:hypothetical protein
VIPISDEMKAGKEPLRSFSDLMQFYTSREESDVKPAAPAAPAAEEPPRTDT